MATFDQDVANKREKKFTANHIGAKYYISYSKLKEYVVTVLLLISTPLFHDTPLVTAPLGFRKQRSHFT